MRRCKIISRTETGKLHSVIYDVTGSYAYVAFARPTGHATSAAYLQVIYSKFWIFSRNLNFRRTRDLIWKVCLLFGRAIISRNKMKCSMTIINFLHKTRSMHEITAWFHKSDRANLKNFHVILIYWPIYGCKLQLVIHLSKLVIEAQENLWRSHNLIQLTSLTILRLNAEKFQNFYTWPKYSFQEKFIPSLDYFEG